VITLACGGGVIGCGGSGDNDGGTTIVTPTTDSGNPQDTGTPPTDGGGTDGSKADGSTGDSGSSTDGSAQGDGSSTDGSTAIKQLGAPTFQPASGATGVGSITVTIVPSAGTPTANSFILYTTDGTLPTRNSTAYSGPIQISTIGTTTIHAFEVAPNFTDSPIATATYTVTMPEAGTLTPPVASPTSQTAINDFLVSLTESSNPAATICYTLDGSQPSCNSNGACTGSSQPYNAAAQIQINGSITNANTGMVTVNSIACQSGMTTSAVTTQQYTLIAAPPQMVSPAPGTLPLKENAGGTAEVAQTPTINSLTNGASIWYTTDGSTPTCITGTKVASPHTFGGPASPGDGLFANTTYTAISCKQGYAPSPVTSNPYVIQLNQPAFPLASAVTGGAPGTYDQAVAAFPMTDTNADATTTASEWLCYTTDGSTPSCGTTQKTCGETAATALTVHPVQNIPAITKTGTVVSVVACNLGMAGSNVAQGTYTLQLDQPEFAPPGIDQVVHAPATTATNAPILTYAIPAALVTTPPTFTPDIEQDLLLGPGSGESYGFACVQKNGTPVCGNGACSTGQEIPFDGSTSTSDGNPLVGALPFAVSPGDQVTAIGCPSTADFGNFLPSLTTTVSFSGPGVAAAPQIQPPANLYLTTQNPVITNADSSAVTLCYTTDNSVPTCTPSSGTPGGTCGNTGTGTTHSASLTGAGAADTSVAQFLVTNGGSGYTSPPAVTLTGGGSGSGFTAATATATMKVDAIEVTAPGSGYAGTVTVTISGGGGGGAAATATVVGGQISKITVTNGGSGYTGPVTVTVNGSSGGSGATATATFAVSAINPSGGQGYTSAPTVTIGGNGGSGATATASLSNAWTVQDIENSNTNLQATVCNASETAPAVVSALYNFQMAEPDFSLITYIPMSSPGDDGIDPDGFNFNQPVLSGAVGSLNTAQTIGAGASIQLSTTSFFPSNGVVLHWTWDGTTATCGSSNSGSQESPSDVGDVITTVPVPATGTTATLSVVACSGVSTSAEATSAARTVTYNVVTADPVITTNQVQPNCPSLDGNGYGCPAQTSWQNDVGVELTSITPNATLCWSLNGTTPVCTLGSNTTSALGGCSTTNNKVINIQTSGTPVKTIACAGSLPNSNVVSSPGAGQAFGLSVTPVVVSPAPGAVTAVCNATVTLALDTAASTSLNLGGPTTDADFCWTVDGTPPACDGSGTSTCLSSVRNCTSGVDTSGGTGTCNDGKNSYGIPLSGNIRTITCSPASPRVYTGASQSFNYNLPGYRHTNGGTPAIVVDGSLSDWTTGNPGENLAMGSNNACNVDQSYFTYDANNLYFGLTYNDAGASTTNYVAVYIGNGAQTGGAPNGPLSMGGSNSALPTDQGIQYMFQWQTSPGTAAPTVQVWNASGASAVWSNATGVTVNYHAGAGNVVEFSIPINQLPLLGTSLSTISVIESVVSGVGGSNPTPVEYTDPECDEVFGNAGFLDAYSSCQSPNQAFFACFSASGC
jgi:hypothetical protein